MKTPTLAQAIDAAITARRNCDTATPRNSEWFDRWTMRLRHYEKNALPGGSGIDCGTKIDLDRSAPEKIVLHLSFHHMNKDGFYNGWTEHTITARPAFSGINLTISGRDRNGIKDYLHDVYSNVLSEPAPDVTEI